MAGYTYHFPEVKPMKKPFSVKELPWERNDGGRKEAGYKGSTGDCVIRSIAIATGIDYKKVYKDIFALAKAEPTFRQACNPQRCSPRYGVNFKHYSAYLESLGWKWVEADNFTPDGGKITPENLKMAGTIIIRVNRHLMTVKDGVVQDTFSPTQLRSPQALGAFVKIA